MARSGLRWVVADAALRQIAEDMITRRHRQRGFLGVNDVYRLSEFTTTYVVFDNHRLVATASVIHPDHGWLPCMDTFPEVYRYYQERSRILRRLAKLVEIGGLGTDEESVRYILAVMRNLPPEIIRQHADGVLADILPDDRRFYERFWGMKVLVAERIHAKDGLPAVCMHYDVIADPSGWLDKFGPGRWK